MMAVEDDSFCLTHEKNRVALYCKTCEVLICTRCVSHGSQSSARHRDHVYLDLNEAFDMLQEDIKQLTSGLREDLQEKRKHMQTVQAKLQRLQLSLLRKKTQLGKSTKSLKEMVKKQEKSYLCSVENLISPLISTAQQQYNDVEFEVVSGDGLLASAEALQETTKEKLTNFLKSVAHVKKEFEHLRSKTFTTYKDDKEAEEKFKRINLHLYREKYLLDRAFTFMQKVPSCPQPLHSWCVVGDQSVSIVWKFDRTDIVKCFNVYYKKFSDTDAKFIKTRERVKTLVKRLTINVSEGCECDQNQSKSETAKDILKKDNTNGTLVPCKTETEQYSISEGMKKEEPDNGTSNTSDNCSENNKGKWFVLGWLFGSAKQPNPTEGSEIESKDGTEESDIVSESEEMQDSEKTSVEESLTSTDEQEEKKATEKGSNKKVVQRSHSYVDPCEFWKEMQLSSSKEAFANPYISSSNVQNKTYCNETSITKKSHSPVRRSSTSSMTHSGTARSTTPSSYTRRRVIRVHSLEPPRNVVSPLLSKHRSQTPTKYVPKSPVPKSSVRSPSPCHTGNTRRSEAPRQGRVSRRDQPMRGKGTSSPSEIVKKPVECTENEDENIKDRFNEKASRQWKTRCNKSKQIKEDTTTLCKMQKKGGTMFEKVVKKKWQKNMRIIHDESEESCPTESEDKDSDKQTETDSHRKRSNTYTKNELSTIPRRWITEKKSGKKMKQTIKKTCQAEYVEVKSIPTEIMQRFRHFKVSRFVLGRVHATLQDLEEGTNYIVLITSENQAGESDASVVHFKTGSHQNNQPSSGHVIKKVQGHKRSWGTLFTNTCSKLCLVTFLAFYMFLMFYLISSHVQSSVCSHLAKENAEAVSKLCPDVIPEELCSQFQSNSFQYCERLVTTDNKVEARSNEDNTLAWFFDVLSNIFSW